MLRRHRTIAAAVLIALLPLSALSGCATEVTGTATAGKIPSSSSAMEEADEESADVSADEESTEVSTSVEEPTSDAPESSDGPVPPVEPSSDAADGDTVAWLSAFCVGYSDLTSYSSPDVSGMSDEAALQTIVDAYTAMSQIGYDTADQLETATPPDFTGSDTIVPAVTEWFTTVGDVYSAGASAIANGSFDDGDQLTEQIDQIEAGLDGVNQTLGSAMGLLDADTRQLVKDLPECALLVGG